MKIFLTGVTGFIGQFLAIELLKGGHEFVFLARSKDGVSARDRVIDALALVDAGVVMMCQRQFCVVEGELDDLPERIDVDVIFHVAGDTSFAEKEREKIMATNLQGTQAVLELANRNSIDTIHYVSSAYAHDFMTNGIVYEDNICGDGGFVNPYAESKCIGETTVREWGNIAGNRAFIYAPSIVVGHSETGVITSFTGYYRFMQAFARLKKILSRKGTDFHVPIAVPGVVGATINIVTIDYVVTMISKLFASDVPGVYHITNSNAPDFDQLLSWGLEYLGITGPSVANNPADTPLIQRPLQKLVARGLADYQPFISYNPHFSQKNVEHVLSKEYFAHPVIDATQVAILLKFAISCNFDRDNVFRNARDAEKSPVPFVGTLASV
jgi:nucleoside-diphosphate-sugar epimerase